MAMQLDIVYSSTIKGAAFHEGGPYTLEWTDASSIPPVSKPETLKRSLNMA